MLGPYHFKMLYDFLVATKLLPPRWVYTYPVCPAGGAAQGLRNMFEVSKEITGPKSYAVMLQELTYHIMQQSQTWWTTDHLGTVGAALCWQHRVAFFHEGGAKHATGSAVGSRDGSRNPRMGATCAPSLIEKIITNNDRNNNDAAKGRGSWERIRWPDAKFEVTSAKCALRHDRPPAQSFARSLTYSLAREMREEKGSRPRKTTTARRREKREERREKSEEKRERREDAREKAEYRPQEAARGPQMRPPEGGQSSKWQVRRTIREMSSSERRGKRAERKEKKAERGSRPRKTTTTRRREKREERREKREERRQKTDPKRPPEVPK